MFSEDFCLIRLKVELFRRSENGSPSQGTRFLEPQELSWLHMLHYAACAGGVAAPRPAALAQAFKEATESPSNFWSLLLTLQNWSLPKIKGLWTHLFKGQKGDSRWLNCKRFALPASAQPSLREGSGTPKSSVGKVRIPEAGSRQVRQAGLAWLGWATG